MMFRKNKVKKMNLLKQITMVMIAVMFMGFGVSILIRVNFGTDPCSSMNLGISKAIGMSFGNWQFLINLILFIAVLILDRTQIGIGTLANMILVGYWADFYTWIWDHIIPDSIFHAFIPRILITLVTLVIFILACAVYMSVGLGTAPYDALPMIISKKQDKVPFQVIRIIWDLTALTIGYMLGSTIGFVTIFMAFALGPVVGYVKKIFEKEILIGK